MRTKGGYVKKILIVDDEPEIREVISFFLESECQAEIIEASSGLHAIECLKQNPDIFCIICDYRMSPGTGGDVFKYLLEIKSKALFVLASSERPEMHEEFTGHTLAGCIEKPYLAEGLKKVLPFLKSGTESATGMLDEYSRIKTTLLYRANVMPCDIYLRLSKAKFIKIIFAQDVFGEDELKRFDLKDLQYLHIKIADYSIFFGKLEKDFISRVATKNLTETESLNLSLEMQETVHSLSVAMGFSEKIETISKTNVSLALKMIEAKPGLADLLKKISITSENYISSHSLMLPYVACGLADLMKWNSDQTFYKLTLASFLHDISLDDDALAAYSSVEELKTDMLHVKTWTEAQLQEYLNHPQKAAQIVTSFHEIPPDVDSIVAQHHELPDGSGFPMHLNYARISPLACLFIIAHDIVTYCYKKGNCIDMQAFVLDREQSYVSGKFKTIFVALKKSIALKNS